MYTKAVVKGVKGKKEIPKLLVDTGATFTVLPPEILRDIGASPVPHKARPELGDGRFVDADVFVVSIWVQDREGPIFVVAFKGAKPVLGVRALEDLGLKVDPVSGTLEPTRPPGVAYYY